MMMVLLLLMAEALASGLPRWPEASATVPGECAQSLPLTKGAALSHLLVGGGALARCSGVVEPLSSYAHLLAIEVHARQVRSLYELDLNQVTRERDYWRQRAEQATPWHRQPWFVAVTTSALVTGIVVTYSLSTGGR